MSSYQTQVIQTSTDAAGITEHQIRLVPVEAIHRDSSDEDDSDAEAEGESVAEEVVREELVDEVQIILQPEPSASDANPSSTSVGPNKLNCMFCFSPVLKFSINKPFQRRVLNNTCTRLFKYICDHLDIEFARVPNRGLQKPPKESQLLPAYLPLCGRCKELYYNHIYETFVTYEAAVIKLSDQIAACITRAIGVSAKQNRESVEGDTINPADIFDAYEKSMNEHMVMRAVRQFRKKVVEKNPAGYIEEPSPSSVPNNKGSRGRGRPTRVEQQPAAESSGTATEVANVTPSEDSGGGGDETIRVGPKLKNVIKIVKNRTDFLQRERTNELVSNRLDVVKQEMDNDGGNMDTETGDPSLNYYAVSNPAPGVIQIIPVVVGENGEAIPSISISRPKIRKRGRSQREDFQKQRIALNTCKFCNKYFPGPSLLTSHLVRHHGVEKPLKCPHCDYRGINKGSLKSHMSTHLQGEDREKAKKFHCHICGARFKGKSGLAGHIRSHSGEKPFVCDVCSKAFTSNTSRQLCMDKHNGVKHHKCSYCDKTFLRKEVLKIHERTHTGDKPFKCKICGKAFAQRSPLNIHLKMHKRKEDVMKEETVE